MTSCFTLRHTKLSLDLSSELAMDKVLKLLLLTVVATIAVIFFLIKSFSVQHWLSSFGRSRNLESLQSVSRFQAYPLSFIETNLSLFDVPVDMWLCAWICYDVLQVIPSQKIFHALLPIGCLSMLHMENVFLLLQKTRR